MVLAKLGIGVQKREDLLIPHRVWSIHSVASVVRSINGRCSPKFHSIHIIMAHSTHSFLFPVPLYQNNDEFRTHYLPGGGLGPTICLLPVPMPCVPLFWESPPVYPVH